MATIEGGIEEQDRHFARLQTSTPHNTVYPDAPCEGDYFPRRSTIYQTSWAEKEAKSRRGRPSAGPIGAILPRPAGDLGRFTAK